MDTLTRDEAHLAGSATLLGVSGVVKRFGGVTALAGVSFDVGRRQICGLIGPNGSGKTTLFNCISGIYRSDAGDITFDGASITGVKKCRMAGLGIGRTFQHVALCRTMTVRANVMLGAHHLGRSNFISAALRLPVVAREQEDAATKAAGLLALLDLETVADLPVGGLPFATQKRVEMARALLGAPKLLLLDEPAGGLNHDEVDALERLLRTVREHFSLSILLVEHHMNLVMRVSDKVVALEFGQKIADGTPEQVKREPEVIRAYLGETEDA